jgi:hypothetical protein
MEELTVGGGRLSSGPTGMAEETADDGETKGKTTARTQGLATWRASRNSAVERWLAGGKCSAGLPRGRGKSCGKEEASTGWSLL